MKKFTKIMSFVLVLALCMGMISTMDVSADEEKHSTRGWYTMSKTADGKIICTGKASGTRYSSVLVEKVEREATCTKGGYYFYKCSCGSWLEIKTDALGHTMTDEVVNPTCTTNGYTKHTCSVCGYYYTDSYVKAEGHKYEHNVVEPTENESGYTEHTCSVCKDYYRDSYTDALEHDYKDTVVAPTCTTKGYTVHKCDCGEEYTDNFVDEIEHDCDDEETAPTCTEDGFITSSCKYCDYKDSKSGNAALGHSYTEVLETVEPTCTVGGYIKYKCERCDEVYTKANGEARGHKAAQAVKENVVAATYDSKGSYDEVIYCSVCGEEFSRNTVETDMLVREVPAGPIVPIIYDYVAPVIEVEEVETPEAAVEETVEEVVEEEPVVEETVEEAAEEVEEEAVVEIEETETPEAAVEEIVEEEVEEEPVVEEDEEELDVDVIETPQGDVLPQTGIASAAVLYGFGAMLAGVGGTVAIKARRKED